MQEIEIRQLGAQDLPVFQALRLESLRLAPWAFGNRFEDWAQLPEALWLERLKTPVFALFLAGEPCGLMGLLPQSGARKCHRATLVMVYLRQSARGAGLADRLLRHVLDYAKAAGHWQIELNVAEDNPRAIAFYERFGFTRYGRLPAAFLEEGEGKAELLMLLQMR